MISCNVNQDLLPLYHDGVCSEDSRVLVEEHVAACPSCKTLLNELRGEIDIPCESPDDLGPMRKIETTVRKDRKRSWIRGAAAVLALILLVFAGVNIRWYWGYYRYYARFGEGQEPFYEENIQKSYAWSDGEYEFRVDLPAYLDSSGYAGVTTPPESGPRIIRPGTEVSMHLFFGGEEFAYGIAMTITERIQVPGQAHLQVNYTSAHLKLDGDLNQICEDYWDEEMLAFQTAIYETYRTEILDIIHAAQAQWPFLTEGQDS